MFKPNLDKILAGFDKTIKQLEGLLETNDARIVQNKDVQMRITDENRKLDAENSRVIKVVTNLKDLTAA